MKKTPKKLQTICICLIEDDVVDAQNFIRILQKTGILYQLHHVSDGNQAIRILTELLKNKISPLLIALDLKIPLFNGVEVLKFIKREFPTAKYDLIITTTSDAPDDLKITHSYKISSYMIKSRLNKELPLYIFNKYLKVLIDEYK